MDVARDCVTPSGFIATTDADTHVAPDWLDATCAELDRGADLVCGSVALDPIEAADVTPLMGEAGALEGQYMNLALELETVLDPDSMNPWPHHGQVSGASLAITRTSYDRAGGLPTPPFGEDRALAQAVRRDDGRIRHSDSVSIVTSCRLSGRATDGMSDSLTRRIADADAVCDEMLEPAETMLLRLRTRAALRRVWPDIAGMKAIAATVDHAPLPKGWGVGPFGAAWQILEAKTPALRRFRVRPSQLPGEIPLLRAALAEARGAAGIQGAARIDVAGKGA